MVEDIEDVLTEFDAVDPTNYENPSGGIDLRSIDGTPIGDLKVGNIVGLHFGEHTTRAIKVAVSLTEHRTTPFISTSFMANPSDFLYDDNGNRYVIQSPDNEFTTLLTVADGSVMVDTRQFKADQSGDDVEVGSINVVLSTKEVMDTFGKQSVDKLTLSLVRRIRKWLTTFFSEVDE